MFISVKLLDDVQQHEVSHSVPFRRMLLCSPSQRRTQHASLSCQSVNKVLGLFVGAVNCATIQTKNR
jgi:hypothetical protein